jgi:hypothetical protein
VDNDDTFIEDEELTDSMTRTQHVDNDDTFIEDEELTDEDRDSPNLGDPGFRG